MPLFVNVTTYNNVLLINQYSKLIFYVILCLYLRVKDPSSSLSHYISTLVLLLPGRDLYFNYLFFLLSPKVSKGDGNSTYLSYHL